ncbi:hypothetical protein AVEN_134682-1 [Araneus ventricosus]|uniref:Secreted protein n=1 Tax=Araneus ventricosus TaxID=182803 RepID=A0A4Y2LML4_ARAVE|nr:hypothetical protein AVEN_134682-1 [Araneus ventricosus]
MITSLCWLIICKLPDATYVKRRACCRSRSTGHTVGPSATKLTHTDSETRAYQFWAIILRRGMNDRRKQIGGRSARSQWATIFDAEQLMKNLRPDIMLWS